jgi:hypothetical protein
MVTIQLEEHQILHKEIRPVSPESDTVASEVDDVINFDALRG